VSYVLDKLAGSARRVFGRTAPHAVGCSVERLGLSPEFFQAKLCPCSPIEPRKNSPRGSLAARFVHIRAASPRERCQPGVVFLFVYLWFLVWMGDALEHAWGAFRVTLFYFLGMVGVTVAAFFFGGGGVSAFLLNSSLFFAFATLYPDVQIYVFFILPLKLKWLAFISLGLLLIPLFGGSLSTKLAILVSFLNYFVFFGPNAYAKLRDRTATDIRKRKFENKASGEESLHRCAVCKRTEKDNPELEFRVSRNGEEYCLDHLPK